MGQRYYNSIGIRASFHSFLNYHTIYSKTIIMMRVYKRQVRNLSPETRAKISEALKGRKKDPQTKKAISRGLKRYWSNVAWEGDK